MSRVEENEKIIEYFSKDAKEKKNLKYDELIAWDLGAMNSFLADISKSMAIIADNMSIEKESEEDE